MYGVAVCVRAVGLNKRAHCATMSAGESFEVEHGSATGAVTPAEAGRQAVRAPSGGSTGVASVRATVAGGDAAPESRAPGSARSVCQSYLSDGKIYSCCHCRAHLASHDEIISKSFQGHHGRAYLFNNLCAAPLYVWWATLLTTLVSCPAQNQCVRRPF